MKNFYKKLALLLTFAMVLGVLTPGTVAKATGTKKVVLDFKNLTLKVKDDSTYYAGYEYAQLVQSEAPTEEKIKAIKDKDWVFVDPEDRTGNGSSAYGDISWFNKKKDSYAVVRFYEDGKYTYIWSDKIEAQAEAFKVFFTTSQEGEKTNKNPAYTSAQAIGAPKSGYLVFYTGKNDTMKVVTPSVLSFRVDGSYVYKDVYTTTSGKGFTSGEKRGSNDIIDALEKGVAKGVTLQFVQMKEDGSSTEQTDAKGWPTAKEVKFKLAAQKAAPTVKVGIDHIIPLKAGQEYRIVNANSGKYSAWIDVEDEHGVEDGNKVKVGKIMLEDLVVTTAGVKQGSGLEEGFATTAGKLAPAALARGDVKIQVRTAATTKAVASKSFSYIVTQAAIDSNVASVVAVTAAGEAPIKLSYKVPYDKTSGLVIENTNAVDGDVYEYCFTVSGEAVSATTKWTAIKGTKKAEVKKLETRDGDAYTAIHVRKAGNKSDNLLSSNWVDVALSTVEVTAQTITEISNGTITGVSGSAVNVTSDGAINVTIPKSAVSGTAITDKEIDITVSGVKTSTGEVAVTKPSGASANFTIAKPKLAANKVTVKFTVKQDTPASNSGEYTFKVEGLNFKLKVTVTE